MKRFFTLTFLLICVLGAFANTREAVERVTQAIMPPTRAESNWVDIEDECMLVDDITPGMFPDIDCGILSYEVMMQEDLNNPGLYRLVNPWQFWPMLQVAKIMGGTVNTSDDFYIEIDATDPDVVKIYPQDSGLEDEEGSAIICSTYCVKDELGLKESQAIAQSGYLEDNVIRFEFPTSILLIINNTAYATNQSGRFAIVLPGGELPIDFSFDVEQEEGFVPDEDYNYHYYVDAEDERIPEIRWMLTTQYPNSTVLDRVAEEGTLCEIGDDVEVSVADLDARMAYVAFVSVDEYGDRQDDYVFEVYPPAKNDSWEYLGKAVMTEDFFATFFKNIESETFEVDVEEHITAKGYYRISTNFANWTYADNFVQREDFPGYIYINITNPERPYIAQSFVGFTKDGKELAMSSKYCQRVAYLGLNIVENLKESSGGVWKDNVLTFEPEPGVFMRESGSDSWMYINVVNNPDCDVKEWLTNPNYDVPRFLSGKFKLDMNPAFSGIKGMELSPVKDKVYYNLQGIEVKNPSNGFYIVRSGNTVTKEYVK